MAPSRKQFIVAHGGRCKNWNWSWSFIVPDKRTIIFGAWDKHTTGSTTLILDEAWARNSHGQKKRAYPESREHVRLIEEEGYALQTFPLIYSNELAGEDGLGPSRIKAFGTTLTGKLLKRVGNQWFASDGIPTSQMAEEVPSAERYVEGASRRVAVNAYERNSQARAACIRHYGAACVVCGFDFGKVYGTIGEGFIHVHHLVALKEIKTAYEVDPISDLVPVCPNCHAMIHSTEPILRIEQLRNHVEVLRRTGE